MTKSELIESLSRKQNHLAYKDVELAVKSLLEQMSQSLATGNRIEIRGFGSFSLHYRPPRVGRNPKTGESVTLPGKHVPHFKPGKELRERVDESKEKYGLLFYIRDINLSRQPSSFLWMPLYLPLCKHAAAHKISLK
ncbi:MAG TPA: integration host factor subunit beta [Gammaproteobacteria bacterium]|nr:integration host factor subunit beta [Gammaproteobacteria bacterium]